MSQAPNHRIFLCRCEDVTTHEIDDAVERGLTSIEEIKRYTGLGTGPCQGKECMCALAGLLIERGLADPATVQPFTARPPTESITFGALATIDADLDANGPTPSDPEVGT